MSQQEIPISSLISTQTGINPKKYNKLREHDARDFSPIEVEKSGDGEGYFVIDGHTRAYVALEQGRRTITANVQGESGLGYIQALMAKDALNTRGLVYVTDLQLY